MPALDFTARTDFAGGRRGATMRITTGFDALRLGRGARFRVCPDIVGGQRMSSFDAVFDVRGKLARAERRAILNTHAMKEEQRQIGSDDCLPGRFAFIHDVEAKRAGVLQLVKAEIPQLHLSTWQGAAPSTTDF